MPRRTVVFTALAVVATTASLTRAEPPAAEFRDGRWQPITVAAPAPVAADPELDHMEQLLDHRDAAAALNVGVRWVTTHSKTAPQRDRALYLLARANDQSDERIKAFYYLDELMDEYAESPLFYPALERQFQIANDYLGGRKDRFLGLPIVDREEEAVEMLFRIQQRSPGSPLAEKALLRTADYYYAKQDYDLAHDAYTFYIKSYPRSRLIPRVKLRQAFASLAQFRGVRFDPTSMLDARAELGDIATAYPELAQEENVAGIITRIDAELATKLYVTADFYRRTGAEVGAVYLYRYLIVTYPEAAEVPEAKRALATMPKQALTSPPPRGGEPYIPADAPATQP